MATLRRRSLLLAVLLSITSRGATEDNNQTCYWPNGQASGTGWFPCSTGNSQCCATGAACLSNGLCFNPGGGTVYRGGCTDPKWGTSSCPTYCNSNFQNTPVTVMLCPPDANGAWRWWCGNDYTAVCQDVNANTTLFDYVSNGYILDIAGNQTESSASATSGAASAGSGPPTISTTGTNGSAGQTTKCPTAAADTSGMVSNSVPIGVGVGLGVPLAILSCAFGLLFARERRKRVQAEQNAASSYNGYAPVPGQEKPAGPVELGSSDAAGELDSRPVQYPAKPPSDQYA